MTGIRLIKRPTGGSWASSGSTTSGDPGSLATVSAAGLTGFSEFALGGTDAILTVELAKFEVKSSQKSALLMWTTATEKDNAYFDIQQSTNGTDFQTIGQVKGHGTTNTPQTYTFEHTTPSVNTHYYRLKQVDFNGTSTYSPVRSVLFAPSTRGGLVVKTALVHDALDISTSDETSTPLSIFNVSGQNIMNLKAQGEQRINVSALPVGLYIIRTANGESGRFIKE
jgi:hypothetical protein